jgi:hypothetical protein
MYIDEAYVAFFKHQNEDRKTEQVARKARMSLTTPHLMRCSLTTLGKVGNN